MSAIPYVRPSASTTLTPEALSEIQELITTDISPLLSQSQAIAGLDSSVSALQTTLGTTVSQVGTLGTNLTSTNNVVSGLQSTVNALPSPSSIVTSSTLASSLQPYALSSSVTPIASAVSVLNSNASTSGSVSNSIQNSLSSYALTSSLSGYALSSSLSTTNSSVSALQSTVNAFPTASSIVTNSTLASSLQPYALSSSLTSIQGEVSLLNSNSSTSGSVANSIQTALAPYALSSSLSSYALSSSLATTNGNVSSINSQLNTLTGSSSTSGSILNSIASATVIGNSSSTLNASNINLAGSSLSTTLTNINSAVTSNASAITLLNSGSTISGSVLYEIAHAPQLGDSNSTVTCTSLTLDGVSVSTELSNINTTISSLSTPSSVSTQIVSALTNANTLGSSSHTTTIAGGLIVDGPSITGGQLALYSSSVSLESSINFHAGTTLEGTMGWNSTNGLFIYDNVNGSFLLQQNGHTAGYLKTANNVLDDGTGNMRIVGTLTSTVAGSAGNLAIGNFLAPSTAINSNVGIQVGVSAGAVGHIFDSTLISFQNNGGDNSHSNTATMSVYGGPGVVVDGNGQTSLTSLIVSGSSQLGTSGSSSTAYTARNTLDDGNGIATFVGTIVNGNLPVTIGGNDLLLGAQTVGGTITQMVSAKRNGAVSNQLNLGLQGGRVITVSSSGTVSNTLDDGNGNMQYGNSIASPGNGGIYLDASGNVNFKSTAVSSNGWLVQTTAGSAALLVYNNTVTGGSKVQTYHNVIDDGTTGSMTIAGTFTAPSAIITGTLGSSSNSTTVAGPLVLSGVSPSLSMNGTTSNSILFSSPGSGPASITTRSAGTKIVLNPSLSSTQMDYAIGIDTTGGEGMWFSIPTTGKFTWANPTVGAGMSLNSSGTLIVGNQIIATSDITTGGNLIIQGTNINNNITGLTWTLPSSSGQFALTSQVAPLNWAIYNVSSPSSNGANQPLSLVASSTSSSITMSSNAITLPPNGTFEVSGNFGVTVIAIGQYLTSPTVTGGTPTVSSAVTGAFYAPTTSPILYSYSSHYVYVTGSGSVTIALNSSSNLNNYSFGGNSSMGYVKVTQLK